MPAPYRAIYWKRVKSGMAFDSPTSDRKSQSHEGRTLQTVGFHNAPLRFDKALFPYRLILFVACAAE